jgi:hypothetical protein
MSEFKGTKENWVKDITERRNKIIVRIGNRRVIELGTLSNGDCNVPSCCKTEEHANALLISKALDLLEELDKARQIIRSLKLSMLGHPDCTYNSEFDDLTTKAQQSEDEIEKLIKEATEL